jgi:hypothetical protein
LLGWTSLRCGPFLCIRDGPGFRDIQHLCLPHCACVHVVPHDQPDSVLADFYVRSNHHPPAMPRHREILAASARAKFDGCVTSLARAVASHCVSSGTNCTNSRSRLREGSAAAVLCSNGQPGPAA